MPSTPLSITATLTPAPWEMSQALVMPYSSSQYSLSRMIVGAGRAQPLASAGDG